MKPKHILLHSKPLIAAILSVAVFFASCKKESDFENAGPAEQVAQTGTDGDSTTAGILATTALEGFGAGAVGGANSTTVYHVTNLNSSGSGSLAAGIGSNRTIVFDVSGTITGRFDLINISYLTIDATGRDITINNNVNGDGISFDGSGTHHCILKNVHVTNAGNDGINVIDGAHDILITNCTSYGNRDGNIDIAAGSYNVTVQYCILGGGASGWSGAMLITGKEVSVHHNLITPSTSGEVGERCPLIHCNYSTVGSPNADFRNNIVWKWGRNGGTGSGYGTSVAYNATANVVNNYYYSVASPGSAVNADDGYGSGATGKLYAAGNVSGNSGVNPNSANNHAIYSIPGAAAVTTQDACTAAGLVLANAGPSPRNSVDQAFINAVALQGCATTPTNQAPTVSAGANQTITLPVSAVTLTGTASDPDGSIVSYAWTKVSGPAATIASPSSISTSVSGLTAGTYIFNLKVTDNGGATANANVTITVNAATTTNQAPTVSAGSAQTITLPLNSVTLTGTASDPDGSIASYAWTKVSGGAATITSPSAISTTVTGLTAGTYIFNLKVTDNGGASANANVTVTVNPAPTTSTPSTSPGTLVYSQGYDISSSVNTNAGIRNKVSFTKYKTGPGSFRSEVRYYDRNLSNGYRGEMIYSGSVYKPVEGVYEYDVYYENWKNWGGGGSTIMWQPGTSGASAVLGLQNYDGKFKVVRAINGTVSTQGGTLMTVSPNTWYKMRWEVKWSSATDGYIRLYINDVLYYSFTGQTTDASGAPTLRVGQYRWNIVSGSNSVVYYDNLKIYKK